MTTDRSYVVEFVNDYFVEDIQPMTLSQKEMDLLLDLGNSIASKRDPNDESEATVDFATLSTSDKGPYLWHTREIPGEEAASLLGLAMADALKTYIEDNS